MKRTNTLFLKTFFLLLGTLFWSGTAFAQAPANDLCTGATVVAVGIGTCGATATGNNTDATDSGVTDPSCSGTNYAGGDIWFQFTVPTGETSVNYTRLSSVFSTTYATLYSGTCAGLVEEDCTSSATDIWEGLTPGNDYYVRLFDWGNDDLGEVTFCLGTPPPPPSNDECAMAIDLGNAEVGTCTGTTVGTTVSSTQSLPGCLGTANDDVWFSFVATNTDQDITITNTGGSTDIVTEAFDGCGGTSLACQDTPNSPISLTGLTVGDTYYFRVYTWSSTASITSEFTVCVGSPPAPPANDDCANAIDLGPAETGICSGTTAGTTVGSTESLAGCLGTANDDVWFSFVATNTDQDITITNTGGSTDIVTEVFDGCGGTSLACQDTPNSPINLTGLTVGDVYYFRVYTWSSTASITSDFTVCVGSPLPPPANDNCASIIDLATLTSPFSGTTCGSVNDFGDDCLTNAAAPDIIWSISVPANQILNIGQTANDYDSKVRIAYGDTCPGDMLIDCNDDPDVETITWQNNTCADQTVYFILSAFSTGCGNFTLEWEVVAPPPAPANDLCTTAAVLPVEEGLACTTQTLGTNVGATVSCESPDPSCGDFGDGQDIWYAVTIPLSGAVNVELSDAGGPGDWAMSIYSGTCGALVEEGCDDDTNGLFPALTITGRTPGEVLLVRLFEVGNDDTGEVNICAFSPALVCDLMVTSETATDETCLNAEDGTITIVATTSFGPINYTITGPVSMTNTTGIFTDLPQGSYTYTVSDDGFPAAAGPCVVTGGPITIAGDATAPVITCPANAVISCDNVPVAAATSADFIAQGGTITEDCGIASVTSVDVIASDICPATTQQTITRTYTVTDDSGNTAVCDQVLTILNSTVGPIITSIPLDQTVDCAVNAFPQLHLFTADGDCGGSIVTSVTEMPVSGTAGCSNSRIQFMYTATDDCGRTAQHVQTYTLINDGPEFVCPAEICVIECPQDNDVIQAEFDDYANLATVLTSCSESGVTITNSFNPNAFISQNCSNPSVAIDGAVAYQRVTFRATDQCGRQSTCTALVVIMDGDGPVISGNIPTGIADCATPNKQPAYDAWINLALSNLSAMDECTGSSATISYSPLSPNNNCQGGLATTDVTFTATDACGNETTINAFYRTIDYGSIPMATVAGSLMTEENQAVELVEVTTSGGSYSSTMMTSDDGGYAFDLEMNQNHAITPVRNDDPLNGITSYDLILMGQHLLEIQTLDSPYKLIAADVNNSGSITSLDLIELRRMILYIDDQFSNNTSWRFVDADYSFPNLNNPFATTFPEAVSINNLSQTELRDFIAIKIGDLNGSAATTLLAAEGDTRDKNELVFQVEDQQLFVDQTYTVDFKAKDFNDILGYQFTLAFDPSQLEMVDFEAGALENLSAENFGNRFKEGVLTSSWTNTEAVTVVDDAILFSITFKANTNVNLSQAIQFNSELTTSEAYSQNESLLNLGLAFTTETGAKVADFVLLQNRPNPFNNETLIAFNLPEMTTATLTIYDVAGRVLKQYKGDFNQGYNEITVNRADLNGAGLLYYQLETPTDVATMKMIVQ